MTNLYSSVLEPQKIVSCLIVMLSHVCYRSKFLEY